MRPQTETVGHEWALDIPALLYWLNHHEFFAQEDVSIVNAWFAEPYSGDPRAVKLTLVFAHPLLGEVITPPFEFHPDALEPFFFHLSETTA